LELILKYKLVTNSPIKIGNTASDALHEKPTRYIDRYRIIQISPARLVWVKSWRLLRQFVFYFLIYRL